MRTANVRRRVERYFQDANYAKLKKFCSKYSKDFPSVRLGKDDAECVLQVFCETDFYVGIELLEKSGLDICSLENNRGENLLHLVCKSVLNDDKKYSSLLVPLVRLFPQLLRRKSKCDVTAVQLVDHVEQSINCRFSENKCRVYGERGSSQDSTDENLWREKLQSELDSEQYLNEGRYEDLNSYSAQNYETYSTWSDRIGSEYREKLSRKSDSVHKRLFDHRKPKSQSCPYSSNKGNLSQTFVTKAKRNSALWLQKLFMKYQQSLKIIEMRGRSTSTRKEGLRFDKIPFPGGEEADLDFKVIEVYVKSKSDKDAAMKILKRERVQWHPDKLKQRYENILGENSPDSDSILKRAVELFQNIDSLYKSYCET